MQSFFKSLESVFTQMASGDTLTEIAAVLATFGLGWFLGRYLRNRLIPPDAPPPTNFREQLAEGAIKISPFIIATLLLFLTRGVLNSFGLEINFLDLMLQLMGALVLIRIGVFLLRLSVGPETWLKGWETRLTLVIWAVVAINLFGWLAPVRTRLNSIPLTKGKDPLTVWSLLESLVIITLFVLAATWLARWIERRLMSVSGLAVSTRIGASKFIHAFLIVFSILIGLNYAGLDLRTLTVFTGALGIGLGFGLQAIASNFVSGFVLLMDRSIKPGDVISFTGVGGTTTEGFGWVQELKGRYVVVRDRDGVETLVPNQNLITNSVINWSYTDPKVRIKVPVRVSYQDDPELALRVLIKAAEGHRRILREPAPVSRLMAFSDSGMDLELRFWIADPQEGVNNVRSEVNRTVWRLFKENNITIPVAQREIRVLPSPEDAEDWVIPGKAQRRE
jgi:small-conductance mechanosensitive channel